MEAVEAFVEDPFEPFLLSWHILMILLTRPAINPGRRKSKNKREVQASTANMKRTLVFQKKLAWEEFRYDVHT